VQGAVVRGYAGERGIGVKLFKVWGFQKIIGRGLKGDVKLYLRKKRDMNE
jgi:hypothetical protein